MIDQGLAAYQLMSHQRNGCRSSHAEQRICVAFVYVVFNGKNYSDACQEWEMLYGEKLGCLKTAKEDDEVLKDGRCTFQTLAARSNRKQSVTDGGNIYHRLILQ